MNIILSKLQYLASGYSLFFLVLGALLGSFYNVVIYRLPESKMFFSHRSFCRYCNQLIPFYYNIPVFSWFFLLGRTKCCKRPISLQYPIVEIISSISMCVIYWMYPFIGYFDGAYSIDYNNFFRFLHLFSFFSLMLISSVIDLRLKIIPNQITLSMIAISPLWILLHPELDWLSSLLGVLFGLFLPLTIASVYYLIRKRQGLGMGDVKILSAIGGWLGYQAILPCLFTASVVGSILGLFIIVLTKKSAASAYQIPFGPFLAIGAMLYQITGKDILRIILNNLSFF